MEKFLVGTKKRYSISDEGIVYRNYRFNRNAKKINKRIIVKQRIELPYVFPKVSLFINGQIKVHSIGMLMVRAFKVSKPDKYHFYDLSLKDCKNSIASLDNLTYKIRTTEKYYPQPFYNNGIITHKICGCCGKKKEISEFMLQHTKGYRKTFRNISEKCRYKRQWESIKSNPIRFQNYKNYTNEWAKTRKGKLFYKKYRIVRGSQERKELSMHYICTTLRIKKADITKTIMDIAQKKIMLYRQVYTNN